MIVYRLACERLGFTLVGEDLRPKFICAGSIAVGLVSGSFDAGRRYIILLVNGRVVYVHANSHIDRVSFKELE